MIFWALMASLIGCSKQEPQPCDTAVYICDTAAYWGRIKDAEATIDSTEGVWIDQAYMPGCNGTPDRWTFAAKTNGWTNGGNLANTWAPDALGGWNEEHVLLSANASASAAWDDLQTDVRDEATLAQYENGARTTYVCGTHDAAPGMVYVYRVYDINGQFADCAIFGTGPNAAANAARVFASNYTEDNPVTGRGEIRVENCSFWQADAAGTTPGATTSGTTTTAP